MKLYLKPTGLTFGGSCSLSLPLAGGWMRFQALEVTLREGAKEIYHGTFPVTALKTLKQQLPSALDSQIDATLERLTTARKAISFPAGQLSFERPRVMGILNLTPDSFSDGGDYPGPGEATRRASEMFAEGADLIDIGAESTRPGASEVPAGEELKRLSPVLDILKDLSCPVSVDTRKAAVMAAALDCGAAILNDVSALTFDPQALEVAKAAPGIVLMHALGTPETMQDNPVYNNVLLDVYDCLEGRIRACEDAGIERCRLIVDPGIGFGKTTAHNLDLLRGMALFHGLGTPIMVGASRKRFIGELTGETDPKARVSGSIAAALLAAAQGVQVIRCHDVRETAQALAVFSAPGGLN